MNIDYTEQLKFSKTAREASLFAYRYIVFYGKNELTLNKWKSESLVTQNLRFVRSECTVVNLDEDEPWRLNIFTTYVIIPGVKVESHLTEPLERARAVDIRGDQPSSHCTLVDELVDLFYMKREKYQVLDTKII